MKERWTHSTLTYYTKTDYRYARETIINLLTLSWWQVVMEAMTYTAPELTTVQQNTCIASTHTHNMIVHTQTHVTWLYTNTQLQNSWLYTNTHALPVHTRNDCTPIHSSRTHGCTQTHMHCQYTHTCTHAIHDINHQFHRFFGHRTRCSFTQGSDCAVVSICSSLQTKDRF